MMTNEEFELAIAALLENTPAKSRRNRAWRRVKSSYKNTKLFNELLNAGYAYRSKWASEYWVDPVIDPYRQKSIRYVKDIRGTGYYIKGCNSRRRKFFKRLSARRFRRNFKLMEVPDGSYSRLFALDMDYDLI